MNIINKGIKEIKNGVIEETMDEGIPKKLQEND